MSLRRGGAALLAVAALAASCTVNAPAPLHSPSQSLAADQSLRVRLIDPLNTTDPALVDNDSELAVARQIAEPLLRPAPDGKDVEPAAAESYELSPDHLTMTFHLRANGKFAGGKPVTAADFVAAWRRVIDPTTNSPAEDVFAGVVKGGEEAAALDPKVDAARLPAALDALGLKALDDLTFQVTLPRPEAQLKWVATMVQGAPPGNGPFQLGSHSKSGAELSANSDYWGGRPTLSQLSLQVIPDDATALDAYRAGQLEIDESTAGDPGGRDLLKAPRLTEYWISFNTERPPFDNQKVRQAFAEAIDRAAIVKEAFAQRAEPATTLIPRGMRDHRPDLGRPQETDPGQAKQLLDSSGAPKDQLDSIHYLVRDNALEKSAAQLVQAQVKQALGLTITLDTVDAKTGSTRLRGGDFQMGALDGWAADYPDEQNWFDLFRSNDGNNLARWRNDRYDLLVREADAEPDQAKRDDLYAQAEQMLAGQAPVAFVAQLDGWFLVQPYVKGLAPTASDVWPGEQHVTRAYLNSH